MQLRETLGDDTTHSSPGCSGGQAVNPDDVPHPYVDAANSERTRADRRLLEGLCVLIVEDHAPIRAAVRRLLERAGCTVMDAGTPNEAIGSARAYTGRVDLALVDLVLPEMSGPECADILVEERPELVIAYMSAYGERVSSGLPGDDTPVLLQKPFARDELLNAVCRVLGRDLQQLPPAYS